jgi:CRISPR/Cas system Type II protein with McrA/HNH and RuvC-like nuclease domain
MKSINKLKQELNQYIDLYGLSDERTIAKSQELDKLIVKEQKAIDKKVKGLALELTPCCVDKNGQLDREKLREVKNTVDEYKYMCIEGIALTSCNL